MILHPWSSNSTEHAKTLQVRRNVVAAGLKHLSWTRTAHPLQNCHFLFASPKSTVSLASILRHFWVGEIPWHTKLILPFFFLTLCYIMTYFHVLLSYTNKIPAILWHLHTDFLPALRNICFSYAFIYYLYFLSPPCLCFVPALCFCFWERLIQSQIQAIEILQTYLLKWQIMFTEYLKKYHSQRKNERKRNTYPALPFCWSVWESGMSKLHHHLYLSHFPLHLGKERLLAAS